MNILFVCAEGNPFIKTGGLADVIGSLPNTLSKYVNCSIVMPYYKVIKEKNSAHFIKSINIKFKDEHLYCGIFKQTILNVDYYFIDNNDFFYNDYIYGYNDANRFTFFNIAVIESLKIMGDFDLLHLNDWHTGLIPFLLKKKYHINIKTIFTIHNIQYQGIFPKELSKVFNTFDNSIEFDNMINFMKSGIVNSDIITTVSPTYKNETYSYEYSYNLENILLSRKDNYFGIINGLDVNYFNPSTDKFIYNNYNSYEGKLINKQYFCNEYQLNENMLCSIVSRLCDQKGLELIIDSIYEIINNTNINLFLMGTGDKYYEDKLTYYSTLFPTRIKVYIGYNESLAQKVYASSDLLFVPSKFEPCGLSQLIAMRYGTLPLVRETGGLKDTVIPFNKYDNTGCGFSFKEFNTSSFMEVLNIAYNTYYEKTSWITLVQNAMKRDFSFENSAKEYLKIYKK